MCFFGVLARNVGLVMKKINIATLINCKYWKLEQFSVAFFVIKLFYGKFCETFPTIEDNKLMMRTRTVPGSSFPRQSSELGVTNFKGQWTIIFVFSDIVSFLIDRARIICIFNVSLCFYCPLDSIIWDLDRLDRVNF